MTVKTAIVTGAASGIGMGYAAALVEKGYFVLVTDVNEVGAKQVAAHLTSKGPGTAEAAFLDVRDGDAIRATVQGVKDRFGRLDLMFNNAGMFVGGPVEDLTPEHWDRAIDVMIRGVAYGVDAAYKIMVEQGFGGIVNTASMAGLATIGYMGPYNMAKHAVVGMSNALHGEAKKHGVHVTCVCPIAINTNILLGINDGLGEWRGGDGLGAFYRRFGRFGKFVPNFILMDPVVHGRKVLLAVQRNKAIIIKPAYGKAVWVLARIGPRLPYLAGDVGTRVLAKVEPVFVRAAESLDPAPKA
ncbi:SDR family oxidoreductase [Nocardia huaxiensis]|uniref:SDR family oxidoreductase n=1 Tax=Nocardia huaxiensis TaxID=2755382 RepID=A0A7D6V882_9NOCA|nr:SDR family oxidoreductase [Nocardia huaxiensis]QLY28042.1 SDR family oxidoreductase [Nocardia huaxiensis]